MSRRRAGRAGRRPSRLALLGLAVALAATAAVALLGRDEDRRRAAPAPPPAVATVVQDDAELLHRPPARIAATLDQLRALGVDWVRITAGWSVIAPQPQALAPPAGFDESDPDAYPDGAWASLDRAVAMARERGLRVLIDIAFWAPRWAVARGSRPERERYEPDPQRFARFAEAVARRYPHAVAFALWNEPNHNVFLLPQYVRDGDGGWRPRSPGVYRAMLRAAYPRVKRAAPEARVLIGNTSSLGARTPTSGGSRMPPLRFLRELACVDERLRPLDTPDCRGFEPLPGDGWAHHPYGNALRPWEPSPASRPDDATLADLPRLSTLLAELVRRGRFAAPQPLYLTEYGYQTNPPDPTRPYTPEQQARFLAEAERIARAEPSVRAVAQFLLRDLPERPGATAAVRWRDYQTGLLYPDGSRKPAYDLFRAPLVARSALGDRVDLWALVRGARTPRPVRIRDARGALLAAGETDADGVFEASAVRADPAGGFRLELRGDDGRWRPLSTLASARPAGGGGG